MSLSQASYSVDVLMVVESVENLGVCTPARALEIRHLSVLSRNREGLSITFRTQLMAGNRKGSF